MNDADVGGDSSAVRDRLRNVRQIFGTRSAFAAVLADGTVVTWGDPQRGGDSSRVQFQLRKVAEISATGGGFCWDFGQWSRGDMGHARPWWRQLRGPR